VVSFHAQRLLDALDRQLLLLAGALGAQAAGVGIRFVGPRRWDPRSSVAVARNADAAGVKQRDPLLLEGALAGVAPLDLLPGQPRVLLAKPTPDSPPGVVAEADERAFGRGVPEVVTPAPQDRG
jgi:hypothetical protein